ncbi:hsp70 family chaperone [Botrytis cinerea]
MENEMPDIIVGVDFGMTYTGVAYSTRRMLQPKFIQRWPEQTHDLRKVPSIIHYDAENSHKPEWGFSCQHSEDKKEWFKRYLDLEVLRREKRSSPNETHPTYEQVKKWYTDYMKCLYTYISQILQMKMGIWDNKRVEFLFSTPTTFQSQGITTTLRELLLNAGFGKSGNHTVIFSLTEPQASAVDAVKDSAISVATGDVIVVCDAGGATTDVAVMEYRSISRSEIPELRELVSVEGINVGFGGTSTRAHDFHEDTAWSMMHLDGFQQWKHNFGYETDGVPVFKIPVPGISKYESHVDAGIECGKMCFTQNEFMSLFDPQVDEIITLIQSQLDALDAAYPYKRAASIKYIILSGGLGSSPYLLRRIRSKFSNNMDPTASSIEVLLSDEPQLSVCRGLVLDRLQKIKENRHVLAGRVCSKSYGVITGEIMVDKQIQWLIKKGQLIDPDVPIFYPFLRHLDEKSKINPLRWMEMITISDSDCPPSRLDHADCKVLSKVTSTFTLMDIDNFDIKKKWRPWYKISKEKIRVANLKLAVVIYPSDIQFQLWLNGQQYMDPNSTKVEWNEGVVTNPWPEETPINSRNGSLAAISEHRDRCG